jgi:Cu/Ag efflux protein CusF
MKISKILTLFFILTFPFSVTLCAEWFDGEVQKIDAKAKTVTISEIDPITDVEEKKEVLVDDVTVFSGVTSLKDIRENDNVTIEAQYDEPTDAWKALSVEVAEAGA